jgi:hypothetical protein
MKHKEIKMYLYNIESISYKENKKSSFETKLNVLVEF